MSGTSATPTSTLPQLPAPHLPTKGLLKATVLSAYDLPGREQPIGVRLTACGQEVRTGAPSARHKENNSFKFSTTNGNTHELIISGVPLAEFYRSVAVLTVEYKNSENNLSAEVPLQSAVGVSHTQWLILNLFRANDENRTSSANDPSQPTLRLQMRLEGPFRPEVSALISAGEMWVGLIDKAEETCQPIVRAMPRELPFQNMVLVPVVPFATVLVAVSPIFIGILIVGLPFFLPILVVLGSILATVAGAGAFLYFSTSPGRAKLAEILSPVTDALLTTKAGECLVYNTGPRPTPVSVARAVVPKELWGKLWISLAIDCIGSSSYLLPFVGEVFDFGWAPVQTIFIMAMYDHVSPNLKYVSFVEEILPLTDVIPSATIGWLSEFGPEILNLGAKQAGNAMGTLVPAPGKSTRVNNRSS